MNYNFLKVQENAESANIKSPEIMKVQLKCSQNEVINLQKPLLLLNSEENEDNAVYYV